MCSNKDNINNNLITLKLVDISRMEASLARPTHVGS